VRNNALNVLRTPLYNAEKNERMTSSKRKKKSKQMQWILPTIERQSSYCHAAERRKKTFREKIKSVPSAYVQ
jgi:hypothetical protein